MSSASPTEKVRIRESDEVDMDNSSSRYEDGHGGGGGGRALSPIFDDEDEAIMFDMMETGAPSPPDGGWGWVVVFASFMCNMIVDGIAYTFGVSFAYFAEEFIPEGEGTGKVAWVGSLLSGVYLGVGPVVSALTNKFGCRIVCIVGAIVGSIGFALSTLSPTLDVLMITYGIIGGIGFGLIYLPAVVCVGYYFETKRALATGIAVCGSGVGTFAFAPIARVLLASLGWRSANLVFGALIFSCAIFGALMKPLEITQIEDEEQENEPINESMLQERPLLQRMADDKRNQLEKGSLAGSAYFMVKLPDGTMERRMKLPLNVDPGVHSSFNLDQLVPGSPITPIPNPTLPTITEGKAKDAGSRSNSSKEGSTGEIKLSDDVEKQKGDDNRLEEEQFPFLTTTSTAPIPIGTISETIAEEQDGIERPGSKNERQLSSSEVSAHRRSRERRSSEGVRSISPTGIKHLDALSKSPPRVVPVIGRSGSVVGPYRNRISGIPRNGSAPHFTPGMSIPKNGSVPFFDRMVRKHSYKAVPLGSNKPSSRSNLTESRRASITNPLSLKNNNMGYSNQEDDYSSLWSRGELSEGIIFSTSRRGSSQAEPRHIIRPFSRKDIFYSGSIANLPEFQSQKSINSYRQSVLNLPRAASATWRQGADEGDLSPRSGKQGACPCFFLGGAGSFKTALSQLMDCSLLKNPVFLFIAVSNVFGMLGFYVPFVYIMQSAVSKGVDEVQAAFLLSIIGIANTIGRVVTGLISDLPQVNSLFMNNMCLLLSGLCVAAVPLCPGYYSYVAVAIFFGIFVSGYISLTSIILVDLLGLENLTNAFGLLILFRGSASIVGAPLAGAVFDAFQSYEIPFYLAGGFLVVSAFVSFLVPYVKKYAPEKKVLQPRLFGGYLEDIPEDAESILESPEAGEHNGIEKFDQIESSV